MRRPLVLFLALALAACVLTLLVFVRERSVPPETVETPAVGASVAEVPEPAPLPITAPEITLALEGHTRSRPALPCDGPTLVVVTAERAPVADAEVRWFACERAFARLDHTQLDDPDAGERYTTGPDGRVRVPRAENGAWVHVADGSRVGQSDLPSRTEGDVFVLLTEAETIHVRVVDHSGAPVRGVCVELGTNDEEGLWLGEARTTSADGRAALECSAALRGRAGELWVEPELLIAQPLHVAAERASSPADPIEIRLPPLGSVRVVVEGARGVDTEANGKTWLWAEVSDGVANTDWKLLTLRDGVARGGRVAAGEMLGARVTVDTLPWPVDCRGPGPTRAGEEAVLALRVAELQWIQFRMLDAGGEPIRGSSLGVSVLSDTTRRTARFATDANGTLRIPLTDPWSAGNVRHATISVTSLGQALLELAREFPPGTTDLGDVHIGDGPRIATGRVVDEQHEPLSNARVQLVLFDNATQSERSLTPGMPRTATGLDGTFELIGLTEPEVYGLRVSASGYMTARRPIVIGETGIVIALAENGSIRGNLVFTGELTRESVEVWLADENRGERLVAVESKGFFRAVDVAPGRWELRVTRAKTGDVLARVGGIEVAPGGRVELDVIEVKEPSEVRR